MKELSEKIDKQIEVTASLRKEETDEKMREYYLGKLVAYAEVQGLIETSKGE